MACACMFSVFHPGDFDDADEKSELMKVCCVHIRMYHSLYLLPCER